VPSFLKQKPEQRVDHATCRRSHPRRARLRRRHSRAGRAAAARHQPQRQGPPKARLPRRRAPGSKVWGHQSGVWWECPRPATHGESCHLFCSSQLGAALKTRGTDRAKRGADVAGILPLGSGSVHGSCQLTWLMEMGVWTTTPPMISVL